MGKQAQKITDVIYLHAHFCFRTSCVHSSGTIYGQELLEAQLHPIISMQEGPGSREEASITCLVIPGLLEMPLGLASGDKRNHGVKPSVSEQ